MIFNLLKGRIAVKSPLHAVALLRNGGSQTVNLEECRHELGQESLRLSGNDASLVEVKASTIAGAGRGLFAAQRVSPGTVLAMYGGVYVPPIAFVEALEAPTLLASMNRDYTYCCEGGGFLDGNTEFSQDNQSIGSVMQFANHGLQPNTVPITVYNFPKGYGVVPMKEGSPWYFSPEENQVIAMPGSVVLKGAVLVSLTVIEEGSELFFDYGMNPPNKWPVWYEHLEDERYLQEAVDDEFKRRKLK